MIEISQINLNIEYMIIYIHTYICVCVCVCVCVYLNKIYFVRNYNFIYMIMNNLTMNLFWYPTNGGLFIGTLIPQTNRSYSLVLWYLANGGYSLGGLFIGTLIPKPMGVIYWYSDTQTNRSYSLVVWYPANGGYLLVLWCPVTMI